MIEMTESFGVCVERVPWAMVTRVRTSWPEGRRRPLWESWRPGVGACSLFSDGIHIELRAPVPARLRIARKAIEEVEAVCLPRYGLGLGPWRVRVVWEDPQGARREILLWLGRGPAQEERTRRWADRLDQLRNPEFPQELLDVWLNEEEEESESGTPRNGERAESQVEPGEEGPEARPASDAASSEVPEAGEGQENPAPRGGWAWPPNWRGPRREGDVVDPAAAGWSFQRAKWYRE